MSGITLRRSIIRIVCLLLALATLVAAPLGCDRGKKKPANPNVRDGETAIELLFPYGSEKKSWITEVTDAFNASRQKTAGGKIIQVNAVPMGSGESKDDLVAGRLQAHLWSPASGVFVKLGNAESQAGPTGSPLLGPTENLVLSPVVIAMWRPMAEALGWPAKPVGWAEVLELARSERGWAEKGKPEWGKFRFGHTHVEYSNSGIISALAEVHAAAGTTQVLKMEDVRRPEVAKYLSDVEAAVVHYGKSTGFFGQKMTENGPGYLSAAVLYENMVIEGNQKGVNPPLAAIYPKEGTFWSDHPVGVVQREWVSEEHKEAARAYIEFLRAPAQQQRALAHGFRPAATSVPLSSPVDAAHGVDPRQPQTTLEVPSADVINAVVDLWRANKKHSDVVLVFDQSGSMKEDNKIEHARAGALEFIRMLGEEDSLTLVPFSGTIELVLGGAMKSHREPMLQRVASLQPQGGTLLYEATARAFDHLARNPKKGRIAAIVVLTDGEDTGKVLKLEQLLTKLRGEIEAEGVRVFTIGYGKGAKFDVLRQIARETKAEFYEGKPENIRAVFRDIATFF